MTISPPAKVKLNSRDTFKVLASGIDTLDLSIDVYWNDDSFFIYLEEMKDIAVQMENSVPIKLPGTDMIASIRSYGRKGHKWILENGDFEMTIGNWLKPKSRPSVMVHIPSEALWLKGPNGIVEHLCETLFSAGAESICIKPSRVDLCLDMTFPVKLWNADLLPLRVTPSHYAAPYFNHSKMTGISIGKGDIAARLYDKPLEIRQKSKKFWMYDIWRIEEEIPEDLKIIRVEGQFRRTVIRELGIEILEELFSHIDNLWGYFTFNWLKFQDNQGKHHTMRTTLPWWDIVQNNFLGIQEPTPLIRCKMLHPKKKQLFDQSYGTLTSLLACEHEEKELPIGSRARINDLLYQFDTLSNELGKSDFEVEIDLLNKRAKISKARTKMHKVHLHRKLMGHPSNIKPSFYADLEDE